MSETPEHVLRNRAEWDERAADYAADGLHGWAEAEPSWGVWSVPEERAGVLPPALTARPYSHVINSFRPVEQLANGVQVA